MMKSLHSLIALCGTACATWAFSPQQAVDLALAHQPLLKSLAIDTLKAQGQQGQGFRGNLPKIDWISSADLGQASLVQDPLNYKAYQSSLQATWTLYQGSLGRALHQGAQANLQISRLKLQKYRQDLRKQTLSAYYEVLGQKQALAAAESSVHSAQERLELAQARKQYGTATTLDLNMAQLELNSRQALVLQVQNQQNQSLLLLQYLCGSDLSDSLLQKADLPSPSQRDSSQRIQLQIARAQIDLAASQVQMQQSAFFPKLDLISAWTYKPSSAVSSPLLARSASGPSASLQLTWNLWNGFEHQRIWREAQGALEQAKLQNQSIAQDLQYQWNSLQNQWQSLSSELPLAKQNLQLAQQIWQSQKTLYAGGKILATELSEAQKNLDSYQNQVLQLQTQMLKLELEMQLLGQP